VVTTLPVSANWDTNDEVCVPDAESVTRTTALPPWNGGPDVFALTVSVTLCVAPSQVACDGGGANVPLAVAMLCPAPWLTLTPLWPNEKLSNGPHE
jgi:hypothetical protein